MLSAAEAACRSQFAGPASKVPATLYFLTHQLHKLFSCVLQVCAGYLLGIGTTKGGTTSLWGLLRGWANSPFHPHLLAPADVGSKELYWWMHSDPYATLKEYDATLQKVVRPPKEVQQEWQQLFSLQSSQLFTCPAPEYKVMRAPPSAFKWINNVNGTAVDQSKLTRLYRADVTPGGECSRQSGRLADMTGTSCSGQ